MTGMLTPAVVVPRTTVAVDANPERYLQLASALTADLPIDPVVFRSRLKIMRLTTESEPLLPADLLEGHRCVLKTQYGDFITLYLEQFFPADRLVHEKPGRLLIHRRRNCIDLLQLPGSSDDSVALAKTSMVMQQLQGLIIKRLISKGPGLTEIA